MNFFSGLFKAGKTGIDIKDYANDSAKGREKYARNIEHKYGSLTLSGLNYRGRIPLKDLVIDLDICENFRFDAEDTDDSEEQLIEKKEKLSELVPKILNNQEYRCVVILGTPGSGKSTFAKGLALKWGDDRSSEDWIQSLLEEESPFGFGKTKNGNFPISIDLEEYAKSNFFSEGFLKFWIKGPGIYWKHKFDSIEKSLKNDPRLVIFEGLDRVSPLKYLEVLNKIVEFSADYSTAKIIVTSRSMGYNPDRLENAEFRHFTIQDLDKDRIEIFVYKFCNILKIEPTAKDKNKQKKKQKNNQIDPGTRIKNKDQIISAIYKSNAGRDLATNPSMLIMMAMILRDRDTLPSDEELDYIATQFRLLHHTNTRNFVEGIERQEQQEILAKIAYEMQFGSKEPTGNSIDDESLKNLLTEYLASKKFKEPRESAVRTIEQLKSDNFIFCNDASFRNELNYSFVNHRILAYFCAMEVKRKLKRKDWISIKELSQDTFDLYWHDESQSRQKSLLSICSVLDPKDARESIESLMMKKVERRDYLDDQNRATKAAFQHLQLAQQCLSHISQHQSLGSITDELKEQLKSEIEKPGISLSPDAAKLLTNLVTEHYHKEIDTLIWLKKLAVEDGDKIVRSSAVQSISEYYHKKSDTLEWLKDRAEKDPDEWVRRAIIRSISVDYHKKLDTLAHKKLDILPWFNKNRTVHGSIPVSDFESPDILTWLKNRAIHDLHELVQREAVRAIAQYYSGSPDTMSWLKDRAIDGHERVRAQVVQSIALYDPQAEPSEWLKAHREDEHPLVRSTAVKSIVRHYYQKSGTLKLLQDMAKDDPYLDVRRVAVQSIAQYYATKNTRTLLQSIAKEDPEESVRAAAVRSISKHYSFPDPLECLEWLQDIALNDRHQLVRKSAVQSIALYYHQEPNTLRWLKTCAIDNPQQEANRQSRQIPQDLLERLPAIDLHQHKNKSIGVQLIAVESIAKYYHTDPKILGQLQSFSIKASENPADSIVRARAVESIAVYYHGRSDILEWLKERAENKNEDKNVRSTAVKSIAKYYYRDTNTLQWLKESAQDDKNVQVAIVESIATYYYIDPKTLAWLTKRAENKNEDEKIRSTAVKSIAKYYYRDTNTLQWLKELAKDDKNVRVAVVESIATYYHIDPKTLAWLTELPNDDKNVRDAVEKSIAKYYYNNKSAVKWLKDRVPKDIKIRAISVDVHPQLNAADALKQNMLEDPDPLKRGAALQSLVKYYHQHPTILTWLKDRCLYDEDPNIRVLIVESIGKYYRKESDIFTWLKDCALNDHEPLVRSAAILSIDKYFPESQGISILFHQIIERDLDRDCHNKAYPAAVALQILEDKYQ